MKKKFNIKGLLEKPWVKNIAAPIAEGIVQSLPGGNAVTKAGAAIIKVVSNIKNKDAAADLPKSSDWMKYVVEVVGLIAIIYLFKTHVITIADVKELFWLFGLVD